MLTHVADVSEKEVRKMSPIYQRFYNESLISNLTYMEKKIYVRNVLEFADVKESLKCERNYGRELYRPAADSPSSRNLIAHNLTTV